MLCDHIDHIDHSLAGSPTFHVDGKTSSSFLRHSGLTRNLGSFIPVILYLQREDINDSSFANAKHQRRYKKKVRWQRFASLFNEL